MPIKVSLYEFFADLSTNAMGTETKIEALIALLDGNPSGIEIDGKLCESEDDIRELLKEKDILEDENTTEKGGNQ